MAAQLPMQNTVTYVDCINPLCPELEQAVGEATGRRSNIRTNQPLDGAVESKQSSFKLFTPS